MSYPYVFSVLPPYQLYLIARFGTIPFSRYRIVQGTHLNSPPLHHPLTASRYRRSTATDLDRTGVEIARSSIRAGSVLNFIGLVGAGGVVAIAPTSNELLETRSQLSRPSTRNVTKI
ncbi:Molybdopterin biosynthesis protein MoeB [Geitlerinema sp. FC II]|nr:Molybdopterin biosynthesis protein MoeB [Geitlerinema sp. FC II]